MIPESAGDSTPETRTFLIPPLWDFTYLCWVRPISAKSVVMTGCTFRME